MKRVLVHCKKNEEGEVILYDIKDNCEYLKLEDGMEDTVDGQMNPYVISITPDEVVFAKTAKSGKLVDSATIKIGRVYMMATTPAQARQKLFYPSRKPSDAFERFLLDYHFSYTKKWLHRTGETIPETIMSDGGFLSPSYPIVNGYEIRTDGDVEFLTEPATLSDGSINSTYDVKITNASYIVRFNINTSINGERYWKPEIWICEKTKYGPLKETLSTYSFPQRITVENVDDKEVVVCQ